MASDSKDFGRAFPYGYKRSEAKKNPQQFVQNLEATIATKLKKPSAEGSWMDKKKQGASTSSFKTTLGNGQEVRALGIKKFPAITKGKTAVSQTLAENNPKLGAPIVAKQKIMEQRAVRSIERGDMYKAGRQVTKAAVYKNRG